MLRLDWPAGTPRKILLHACCAPCGSAILECLLQNDISPTVYYYNPNIHPFEEYAIRREESRRQCAAWGVAFVEGAYDHEAWLQSVSGLEGEPERGGRCAVCFRMRLAAAALKAGELGLPLFATTLASSRWKDIRQIEDAGRAAEHECGNGCAAGSVPLFYAQNWRKGGLSERRAQLLREGGFYNQTYCGCEFSVRGDDSFR